MSQKPYVMTVGTPLFFRTRIKTVKKKYQKRVGLTDNKWKVMTCTTISNVVMLAVVASSFMAGKAIPYH